MGFKNYKLLHEDFDMTKAVKDATGWLKGKYEDKYNFKHIENMSGDGVNIKSYDIVVGSNAYKLDLRKFDSNGDGDADTVGFSVNPTIEPDDEEDEL